MKVFNRYGACADIKQVVCRENEIGNIKHIPTGCLGVIVVDNISFPYTPNLQHANEILSSMFYENNDGSIVEHHGVIFYRLTRRDLDEDIPYQELIDQFKKSPKEFEAILPRTLTANRPYVFFSRKYKINSRRERRKV
jgi:hypothetical protein